MQRSDSRTRMGIVSEIVVRLLARRPRDSDIGECFSAMSAIHRGSTFIDRAPELFTYMYVADERKEMGAACIY